ncbi:MAG: GNAT family N-acetyltransferase [Myxococcota bacterium]|nr:GNAT family N-acetyltransferase [Myxococcota bacterium]
MLHWLDDMYREATGHHHRRAFILSGTAAWTAGCIHQIRQRWASGTPLVMGQHPFDLPDAECVSHHLFRGLLGTERRLVIIDCTQRFDVDVLGAICGVVQGGGAFVLACPPWNDQGAWRRAYSRHLTVEGAASSAPSHHFIQRFAHLSLGHSGVITWQEGNAPIYEPLVSSTPLPLDAPAESWVLTDDQAEAVNAVLRAGRGRKKRPIVLRSDRGRGKSAALGIAAGQLLGRDGYTIALVAPSLNTVRPVFEHARRVLADQLDDASRLDDCLQNLVYYAPSELITRPLQASLVMVDEAAALPVPALMRLLLTSPRIVFSTTVHGYEGTGRGFTIRFSEVLNEHRPHWREVYLNQPIRWAQSCPVETWLAKLLILNHTRCVAKAVTDEFDIQLISRAELVHDEKRLSSLMGLFVSAHYRTSPSDLVRILDAPNGRLWVAAHAGQIIGAALVFEEGGLNATLAREVVQGHRRPRGHTLPCYLANQPGLENVLKWRHWRVARIAVSPENRRQGVAARLMRAVRTNAMAHGVDVIGALFGATPALVSFWRHVHCDPLHMGIKRSARTGLHSAVVMQGLTERAHETLTAYTRWRRSHLHHQFLGPWRHMEAELVPAFTFRESAPAELNRSAAGLAVLKGLVAGRYDFATAFHALRPWAFEFVATKPLGELDPLVKTLIVRILIQGWPWSEAFGETWTSDRAQALRRLKKVLAATMEDEKNDEGVAL